MHLNIALQRLTKKITNLVLLQSTKLAHQSVEGILAAHGRNLGARVADQRPKRDESKDGDGEPAQRSWRRDNGDVGSPHGENLLLLMELRLLSVA